MRGSAACLDYPRDPGRAGEGRESAVSGLNETANPDGEAGVSWAWIP